MPNVATIAWKDNYLFLGNWDLKDDYRYYFESYYKGFYANSYIEEEQFGKQPKKNNKESCLGMQNWKYQDVLS